MNKNGNKQTENRIQVGVLPQLIRDGKAFNVLAKVSDADHGKFKTKYRQRLYEIMDDIMGDDRPQHHSSYHKYFYNPEKNVNAAFLSNKFKKEEYWLKLVTAMNYAMGEVLMEAVQDARAMIQLYKDRDAELSDILNSYVNGKNE
ncbi:MAG: hypothetical protein K9I68_05425 [Bacteroidales bacterium]|nr:hypothetical protein [Bacteroidales bacterium]